MTRNKEAHRSPQNSRQTNFFDIVPEYTHPWNNTVPTAPKDKGVELEENIDRLHWIFQSSRRDAKLAREKEADADTARERRQLLKALGVTQKARSERMRQEWAQAMQRLTDAGVMEMVHPHMTTEETQEVIFKLQQYDHDQQQPIRDLDSSEGFAIYPTVKSWYRDHE